MDTIQCDINKINKLIQVNTTAGWAKGRLKLLLKMYKDRFNPASGLPTLSEEFLIKEIARIEGGIKNMYVLPEIRRIKEPK